MGVDDEFDAPGDPERTAYVVETIRTIVGDDFNGLSVLDLACRTGAFSRAVAAEGAKVLGVEGKEGNYGRIPHADNARFVLDDVRNVGLERYGQFDVTLCLGILYHLDAVDAIRLLERMREVTGRFAIIDTHIGNPGTVTTVDNINYEGHWYGEGVPGLWSSLGNSQSFWFTPESLQVACFHAGWSQVTELPGVRWPGEPAGRHWLVLS